MSYDPLDEVLDEPLRVDKRCMKSLELFLRKEKFVDLPGVDTALERSRLTERLDELTQKLLDGIEANPSKRWVMARFQETLQTLVAEDTEAREHFGLELEAIMDILSIESSDGLLSFYLGGF